MCGPLLYTILSDWYNTDPILWLLSIFIITLGTHVQRGYGSWVCLSVTQHLNSGTSVRVTNDTVYLTGNEGQKYLAVFSESAPLERYSASCIVWLSYSVAIFTLRKTRMRHHAVCKQPFCHRGRKTSVVCE